MSLVRRAAIGSACIFFIACATDSPGDGEPELARPEREAPAGPRAAPSPAAGGSDAGRQVVTLITGDRITVAGAYGPVVSIAPGPGRRDMRFRTVAEPERLLVIPADAQPLVAAGALDRRLFDVTGLIELGYDDAHRPDLPVLVTRARGEDALDRSTLARVGGVIKRSLPSVGGEAVAVPKEKAAALWGALGGSGSTAWLRGGTGVRLWLDGKRELLLDHSAPQIGAPAAWAAGYTGAGVTVAVLDTGIDDTHPDFAGRIAGRRNFVDPTTPDAVPDFYGHGTHVASIVAGSGAGDGGVHRGIAPDATILVGKVCEADGCPESSIIAGMEWAAESGARVVNMSLGGIDEPGDDPTEQSLNALTAQHGTLFVVAAGNSPLCGGPFRSQVTSPGTADAALSVGAVDGDDVLAFFSCSGPRAGDGAVKPDLTAPGVSIAAARAPGTPVGDGNPVGELYTRASGTSMATPHVSGAAAVLAQEHPDWRAAELKAALMAAASPADDIATFEEGAGRVDVARAIDQTVLASPSNLVFGSIPWPHDDDEPVVRSLTYRNVGATSVDLALSIDGTGPDGEPAPAGMFTITPEAITVPPGGEVQVEVVVDTRVESGEGAFAAIALASGGDQVVRTPVSLIKEPEAHDLVLRFVDRQGQPTTGSPTVLDLQTGLSLFPPEVDGVATLRLPRGQYTVDTLMRGTDDDGPAYRAVMVQPLIELSESTETTFDARSAGLQDVTVPDADARPVFDAVAYARLSDVGYLFSNLVLLEPDPEERSYLGQVGPEVSEEELATALASAWAIPAASPENQDRFFESPTVYNLFFAPPGGRFPDGFTRHVVPSELAAVEHDVAAVSPGRFARILSDGAGGPLGLGTGGSAGVSFRTPARRIEYYTTDPGTLWRPTMHEVEDGLVSHILQTNEDRAYEAGQSYRTRWNGGVLGPSFETARPDPPFLRVEDFLLVFGPSFLGDGAGHRGPASTLAEWHLRVLRGGEVVAESDSPFAFLQIPPEEGELHLEVDAARDSGADRSTQISTAWTFRSATTPFEILPLMAVRLDPTLDRRHRAPGGVPFVVPLSIQRQDGSTAAPLRRLQTDVSYDGGETWQAALTVRIGDRGFAFLVHPASGTVSLRARAEDRDGRTVEQTIVDAYRLR